MTCKCEKRGAKEALVIMAMQDGGFTVVEFNRDPKSQRPYLFACSTMDEALKYIKGEMEHG